MFLSNGPGDPEPVDYAVRAIRKFMGRVPVFGIAGAGLALAIAYAAMIVAIHLLTRRLFEVRFEWGRLTRLVLVFGAVAVPGDAFLPSHGLGGVLLRGVAWCAIFPLLRVAGFFNQAELQRAAALGISILRARRR